MKKILVGVCSCIFFMTGCQSEGNKDDNQAVISYEKANNFAKTVGKIFETTVGKSEVILSELEELIMSEIDDSVERIDIEGKIIYKSFDKEIEIDKGIEGKIDEIKYIADSGSTQISYILDMDQTMVKVLKKYDNSNAKINDLNKLSNSELQKKYLGIVSEFDENVLVKDIENIMNYKFKEENVSDILGEEQDIKMYFCSEGSEGIVIKEVNGKVVSVRYNNMPTEENMDVRSYVSEINSNGEHVYSVEVYNRVDDRESLISIKNILK